VTFATLPTPDTLDRVAKILMDAGQVDSYAEAQLALNRYAVTVHVSEECAQTPAGQAALLTIAVTGSRALPGGVFVDDALDVPVQVGTYQGRRLRDLLVHAGAHVREAPHIELPVIRIGTFGAAPAAMKPTLQCFFEGWRGGVFPAGAAFVPQASGSATTCAAVLAGAIAVSEIFQFHLGGNVQAGRRTVGLSLWRPGRVEAWWEDDATEARVAFLPSSLWLIGLGHLGQAYLWVFALLPYLRPAELQLVLQDFDRLTQANTSTSVLTTPALVGELKTRAMAAWAEHQGFRTQILERKFAANFQVSEEEPTIALCGVDNAAARAALGDVGFRFIVNAGLGAGPVDFMAMRFYTFPGPKNPRAIWGTPRGKASAPIDRPAYRALRDAGIDDCGLTLLAERTVGAPFVGVTAAAITIAEILRALHGGGRTLIHDATLEALEHRQVLMGEPFQLGNPGFTEARP